MSTISATFDGADHQPVNGLDDARVITDQAEPHAGCKVNQSTTARAAVTDETTAGNIVGASFALRTTMAARQQLTKLTHTLFLRSGGSHVAAFSGVETGAGCSWILVRVAELLADAHAGSVCVVDANFRDPMLHKYLGIGNRCGLSDALVRPHPVCEYVSRLGHGQLHLLTSGSMIMNNAEPLLASSAFRICADELRAAFDFVLFDTPALAESSASLVVASRTDGLAMVVEADSTNREATLRATKDAVTANVSILGVVLNKRSYPIPEMIYKKL